MSDVRDWSLITGRGRGKKAIRRKGDMRRQGQIQDFGTEGARVTDKY